MKAKKAKELALISTNNELKEVISLIKNEAEKGNFILEIKNKDYPHINYYNIHNPLKNLGYEVDTDNDDIIITW